MIQEAYCSYEVSKLLKEKGFDMHCDKGWDTSVYDIKQSRNFSYGFDNKEKWISCPTHQLAMAWLREVHHIHIDIIIEGNGCCIEYKAHIRPFNLIYPTRCFDSIDTVAVGKYKTYEEATEAGLKYCLENLI